VHLLIAADALPGFSLHLELDERRCLVVVQGQDRLLRVHLRHVLLVPRATLGPKRGAVRLHELRSWLSHPVLVSDEGIAAEDVGFVEVARRLILVGCRVWSFRRRGAEFGITGSSLEVLLNMCWLDFSTLEAFVRADALPPLGAANRVVDAGALVFQN